MTIYINGKFLCQQKTGTQMYGLSMLKAMQLQNIDFQILAPKGAPVPAGYSVTCIGVFSQLNLWEQISLPFFLCKKKDSLLINFCNSAPLLVSKQMVTIHDLAFEQIGETWFSASFRLWYKFLIPRISKKALGIFTVSQFSKDELIKQYHLSATKIKVLPNVIHTSKEIAERQVPQDYLLLIGAENPRKNASFILAQLNELKRRGLLLVMLSTNASVFKKSKHINDSSIINFNYVDEPVYYSLIKYAKALIYVSKYEGFGVPILESLYLQTPVICSNLPVFKESFGDLPIYLSETKTLSNALDELQHKKISSDESQSLTAKYSYTFTGEKIFTTLQPFLN